MKKRRISLLIISFCSLLTIGHSTWIITSDKTIKPEYNATSALTTYVDGLTSDAYIYQDTILNGSNTNATYSNIKTDKTYIESKKTIYLGYSNGNSLNIDYNVHFTHNDSKATYSETEFNNDSSTFHTGDGNVDKLMMYDSDGNGQDHYYTSKSNATNNKQTTVAKNSQWINFHYHPHTYNHYLSDGSKKTLTVPSKRLYTVKLAGDVILSSGKTLSIGAHIGATTGAGFAGSMIEGNFVMLDLNGHTLTIESGATLNAYGYIVDSKLDSNGKHIGKIDNYGTIYAGFVVENYSGGGNTVATGAFGTAPFSMYSVPYLTCKTIFNYGSSLKCPTSLYPNSQFSKVVVNMIGSSGSQSLMEINDNSSIIKDTYNPYTSSNSSIYAKENKTYYTFNGDIDVKTLKMLIKVTADVPIFGEVTVEKTINMAEFGFTIPPYFHVNVESGITSIGMQIDFMPGSTVTVQKGATVEFTNLSLTKDETLSESAMTSYGGIRMLSHMSADTTTCYGGSSYGVGVSNYSSFLSEEGKINVAGNTDARANIYGNIKAISNTNSYHKIGGKINLSDAAHSYIVNNINSFNTYSKDYDYYAYISGSDLMLNRTVSKIKEASSNKNCASYTILPLVSNGKVVNPTSIYSGFSSSTTYDFSEGIYHSNGNNYAYIPSNSNESDTSGSIQKVNHNADNHQIEYDGNNYTFFRNMFVQNKTVENNNFYVYDNMYISASANYSEKTYNVIDFQNKSVRYTYKYNGAGTIDTATYTVTRKRTKRRSYGSWSEWSVTDDELKSLTPLDSWGDPVIVTGTETTTTTSYVTENVTFSTYSFSSTYKDENSYKNIFLVSTINRPSICSKFSQSTSGIRYIQVGSINLYKDVQAKSEITDWLGKGSFVDGPVSETTSGSIIKTYTQTKTSTVTATRNNSVVDAQTWLGNSRPMYTTTISTCLKWSSTYKCWIKG